MDNNYQIYTLPNGMRLACRRHQGMVSYIGVTINAGSRDELLSRQGLAHFVEHTLFKGTDKRRSWQISNRMETVGGELNAYTSKEETMIYTSAPAGYEERAVELIADLITSSRFPDEEIEREKEVVIEEIYSYLDSPSESVYDEFEDLAYAGSGLAHNILGTPESVRSLHGEFCREFIDRHYTPGNMVAYCLSPLDPDKFYNLACKYFGTLHYPDIKPDRSTPPLPERFDMVKDKDHHQANTIIGARVFGRKDPARYSLFLLNNYLGGPNMNSRLNRELREKRGYVYAVDSSVSLLSDTGLWVTYFGCEKSKLKRCRQLIMNEIDRLCQKKLSANSIEKMKRQYCGQLLLSSDHSENRAMAMAKSLLYYGEINDISVTTQKIMEVTADELMETARLISPANCNILSLT